MATEWYLMGSMPVYNSGFEKEEFDAYAKDSFTEILETSPVSETIQIINNDLTLVSEIKAIILNDIADSSKKSVERQLLVTIGTLQCGDYISYENLTWVITSFVGNNGMYEKAIAELCNYTIKFQSTTGTILSYPSIASTNSTTGISEGKTITVGDAIYTIKLPFDANTLLIDVDDRFFIDDLSVEIPQVYAVSKPNRTEFKYGDKGLIELTMKQSQYNVQTDKKGLGVCNYFEPVIIPDPPDPDTPTEIVTIVSDADGNNIKLGLTYTFTATFKNELGENVDNVIAEYSIDNTYGGLVILGNNGDGTCTINVNEDAYDLLTETVELTCTDIQHGFSSSILLTIVGLF